MSIRRNSILPAHGFTLLEVMVALVIFSIGLLGLAGLQARGLQSNASAYYRSLATIQAYDMADRIRSNPEGVSNGNYDNLTAIIPPTADCITNTCDAATLARFDHYEWNSENARQLPSGRGTVQLVPLTSQYAITVMWDEDRTGVVGTNCSGDPTVDLKCFRLVIDP